ncbi:Hachiman antiphage defense system protein HamA [Clostridium butyricum]|uniref:Hachiman antiphage defense system protein HamA n=1 Tax=Clostridium butyricum TaxID=1492 RepID=UPI00374F4824
MIRKWLKESKRSNTNYFFDVIDLEELKLIDEEILNYLGKIVLESYSEKLNLKMLFKNENEEILKDYLFKQVFPDINKFPEPKKNQPTKNVMQGDFGEILTCDVVRKIRNLKVPIIKMRFKFNNNRSVFCTDLFAHNLENNIKDLMYYEVKTRLTNNKEKIDKEDNSEKHYIGYIAARSLMYDQQSDNSEGIADFLMRWYSDKAKTCMECSNMEKAEEYFELSKKYGDIVLHSDRYNKHFEVVLIMEKSKYNDDILDDLQELNFSCGDLKFTILLIENIKELYMKAFDYAYKYAKEFVYGKKDR